LIASSSSGVGIVIAGRLDVFDMVLHLTAIGSTCADDAGHVAELHKSHEQN